MGGPMGGPELLPLEQALVDAAQDGLNKEIIKLLAEGVNIHTDHDCPLRIAAYYKHMNTVEILLDHGADIHALDDEVLWWVSLTADKYCLTSLIERGADVQAHNDRAVRKAAQDKKRDITLLLMHHGADPFAKDAVDGKDAFHNTDLEKWLKDVRRSLPGKFSVPPTHEQCFKEDGKVRDAILDACITGQFEHIVSLPLLASEHESDRKLFRDVWHALPECWQKQHQNSFVQYLKSGNSVGLHTARIRDKPALVRSVA